MPNASKTFFTKAILLRYLGDWKHLEQAFQCRKNAESAVTLLGRTRPSASVILRTYFALVDGQAPSRWMVWFM